MMEAVRNSKMGVRVLFVLVAMMVASMMLNAPTGSLGGSLGTEEADAAVAHRQIKGTIFRSDGGQVRNGYADLYYKTQCVQSTPCPYKFLTRVQANSLGQYNFGSWSTGHTYYIKGWSQSSTGWYSGNSSAFYLSPDYSTAFTKNVTVQVNPW